MIEIIFVVSPTFNTFFSKEKDKAETPTFLFVVSCCWLFSFPVIDFISDIANRAGTSKSNLEHTSTLVDATDEERQDKSGVSMDEELSQLIRFQHSYSASASVVQTLDSMIQTLILSMAV